MQPAAYRKPCGRDFRHRADRARLAEFESWAEGMRERYICEVGRQFESVGMAPDTARLAEIRRTLNAWRYIERMIEQLAD